MDLHSRGNADSFLHVAQLYWDGDMVFLRQAMTVIPIITSNVLDDLFEKQVTDLLRSNTGDTRTIWDSYFWKEAFGTREQLSKPERTRVYLLIIV